MKITNKNARMDRSGKHNDRNFNLDNAPHIDQDRVAENIYYTYNGDDVHKFNEVELEFYEKHFTDYLNAQNARNEQIRHKERNRTIEEYARGTNTRPEDKILQIGDIKHHATKEQLWECALEYLNRFNDLFGDQCKILDMALHMDEATPHVHVRRVWIAKNDEGQEYVNQKRALEQLGITRSDQDKPEGRYNNPKMTFTQTDIQLFRDICIEKGLDIDQEPPERRKSLSTLNYKKQEIAKDIESLERERDGLSADIKATKKAMDDLNDVLEAVEEYIDNNPFFDGKYDDEIEEAKKKDRADRFRTLAAIFDREVKQIVDSTDEFEKASIRAEANSTINSLEGFLKDKGLYDEYLEFRDKAGREEIGRGSAPTGRGSFF